MSGSEWLVFGFPSVVIVCICLEEHRELLCLHYGRFWGSLFKFSSCLQCVGGRLAQQTRFLESWLQ